MTKHLRLIMLSLLAMICMGGYSQSETDFTTVSWKSSYTFGKYTMTAVKGSGQANPTQNKNDKDIRCYAKNKLTVSTKDGKMVKIVFVLSEQGKKQCSQPTVDNGTVKRNPADETQGVSEVIWENSNGSTSVTFTIGSKAVWSKGASSKAGQLCFDKIVITDASSKTPTTTTFGVGVDNNTFKVKDGETFEGWGATCTTVGATGTIEYKSSDAEIATVDATTGAITLGAKYGTATITAQFVATGNYANSEARYSIKHLEDFVFYESFDKCNGEGGIDDSWSGSLSGDALSDNKSDKIDNPGWTFVNGKERTQCASFGTTDDGGSATSPNIQIDQKAQLKFKAACWNTQAEKSQITISVSNGTLTYNGKNSQSVTIDMVKAVWTDYSMIVSGTKSFTVKFAGSGKNNRFFLDEVMVIKVAPQEITLDENSDNIVAAAENVNVTLKRKLIADDNWNTLCVPFNLTPEQTTKAFGADVELRTLTHAEGTTLTFGKVTEIEAGKPYLIRVKEVPTDYVYKFTGVKVIASGDNWTIQNVGNVNFIGLYAPRDVTELEMLLIDGGVALFLGDNNKFFRAQSGAKMGGFRAFFLVSKDTNPTNVKAVIDGVANGIEDLVIDGVKANGRVYNLNGQYVGKSLNGLQPGLYIQNGKKIVIK